MTSLPILDSAPASAASDQKSKGTYAFVSLGCPKNLVDSERMLGLLQIDGYKLVREPVGADFVIVNTCGFIESARAESYSSIDEMLKLKSEGKTRGVIVSGCLAERQKELLLEERPGIDALVGVFGREEVTRVADRLIGHLDEQRLIFQPAPIRALADDNRLRITPRHFAYLKISEGCDRLCTFCAIPKMRGKHATKPMEVVLREAKQLAADGVRELNIVAQDTPYYGIDLYGEPRLAELLAELVKVEGIEWIRLLYFYPMYVSDKLIETIAAEKKIIPYIDMPLQHISDSMLRRMSRRVSKTETVALLKKMREKIPNLTMRTTFITGFPGETEEDVSELAAFVKEQKFQHVGVFPYSLEPDTPAAKLEGHIPEEIKHARRDRIMQVQQHIAFKQAKKRVGQTLEVIIDRPLEGEENVFIGRTKYDAPDIDSVVYVTCGEEPLKVGQFTRCEIAASQEYDLVGVAVGKPW